MTHLEIIDLLEKILTFYPHAKINLSGKTVDAWYEVLGACDNDNVNNQLMRHIQSGNKFAPSVAELYVAKSLYDPKEERKKTLEFLKRRELENQNYLNYTEEERERVRIAKQRIESILYDEPND